MKISSRVSIRLICGGEDYVRAGGKDHRASLPTILNEIRKEFERCYYCGSNPRPELYFYERSFVSSLNVIPCDENPGTAEGAWEYPYASIPCEYDTERFGCYPAEHIKKDLCFALGKLMKKWRIDSKAYKIEISQWTLDVEPDDSTECDFFEEDIESFEDPDGDESEDE